MKITKILTVAIAAVFLAAAPEMQAADNVRKIWRGKIRLKTENQMLRSKIDSLLAEIDRYKAELHYTDSISSEMLEIYIENENKSAAGFSPEDYTPELSDSLLNIWYTHKMVAEDDVEYDMDSVRFQSDVPDSVYIEPPIL